MKKIYDLFLKVITYITITCILISLWGNVLVMANGKVVENNTRALVVALLISFSFVLYVFVSKLFLLVDKLNLKFTKIVSAILFGGIALILVLILLNTNIMPSTDEARAIDTAYYLMTHSVADKNMLKAELVGRFPNNYSLTLLQRDLMVLFKSFGIDRYVEALHYFNAFAIWSGVLFFYLFIKEAFDIKMALKALILFAANPLTYGYVTWSYTNVLSIPIMAMSLYFLYKLINAKSLKSAVVFAVIEGFVLGAGVEIRITALFVIIAFVVLIPLFAKENLDENKININIKQKVICICAVCIGLSLVVLPSNARKNSVFGQLKEYNMPFSYFLILGSTGEGTSDDNNYCLATNHALEYKAEQRGKACLNKALELYKEQGLVYNLQMFARKTTTNWSDGYGLLGARILNGELGIVNEFGIGSRSHLLWQYCNVFRFLTLFCSLAICFGLLKSDFYNNINKWLMLVVVALFGGFVFYMLWEVKADYSTPFVPLLIILSTYFIDMKKETVNNLAEKSDHYKLVENYIYVFFVFLVILMTTNWNKPVPLNDSRINATYVDESAGYYVIDDGKCTEIKQDFYLNTPFSEMVFDLELSENSDNISPYTVVLMNDAKEIICDFDVQPEDVAGGKLVLKVDNAINATNHYTVIINKLDKSKDSIGFLTRENYYLDHYRGKLSTDITENFVSDLLMDVNYYRTTTCVPKFIILALVFGAVVLVAFNKFVKIK